MELLPGVRARTVETDRLRLHVYESGPDDGVPVVLVHGNLSTGRFYEYLMSGAPERYRLLAPDMRGFGRTQAPPIDATRGLRDWADDTHALVQALAIERPVHLAGWSTGGGAIPQYGQDRAAASLTLIDPSRRTASAGSSRTGRRAFPTTPAAAAEPAIPSSRRA